MILNIKNNEKKSEIVIGEITQWCGENIVKKEKYINIITKYFSKAKYMDYERNLECEIYFENNLLGRNFFNVYEISSRNDIVSEFKLGKNTLATKYLLDKVSKDFDMVSEMEMISDILSKIFSSINDEVLSDFNDIMIDFEASKLFEIVQKGVVNNKEGENINFLSNYDLIINYINLVKKIEEGTNERKLIIIENIDHLLNAKEYRYLYEEISNITKNTDISFLMTISIDGYCIIDKFNIENIFVINDEEFIFPSYNHIENFIEMNYPRNIDVDEDWLLYNLEKCANKIGKSGYAREIPTDVILKMINGTLNINSNAKYSGNGIEFDFIGIK